MPALPDMVLTPKAWYRETERPGGELEQLLNAALSHSLPCAPFLAITVQAFDAFCSQHKLATLDRENSFPLEEQRARSLVRSYKRLILPDELVRQIQRHYPAFLGKHEVSLFPDQAGSPQVFVGEVSALAAIRSWWAHSIARFGVAKTRSQLHKQPLYLIAKPKHTLQGTLKLKDKFVVELTLNKADDEQVLYLDLTNGTVSAGSTLPPHPPVSRLPFNALELTALARGLYRKSLYKGVCPIAGAKTKLWIQPDFSTTRLAADSLHSSGKKASVLAKGESRGKGIAVGQVILVTHERDWRKVRSHHIVVTNLKLARIQPVSLTMRSLISERVSIGPLVASHLRELRFPFISGVAHATKLFKNGQVISLDAGKGVIYAGNPFAGSTPLTVAPNTSKPRLSAGKQKSLPAARALKRIPLLNDPKTIPTSVENLPATPRVLFSWGEAIVKELGVHPTRLWHDKQFGKIAHFIESGLSAFSRRYPNTVIMYALADLDPAFLSRLRFSPDKHVGHHSYFGLRGAASLLLNPGDFSQAEIQALSKAHAKRIRLDIVLPFCRTPQELIALKRLLAGHHLIRGGYVKLFFRIETLAHLTELDDYSEAGIDGVVLDMHRLHLFYSGINTRASDHAPLKKHLYEQLAKVIDQHFVGVPASLPVYGWYSDYDIAYTSELYPKRIKGFIA